MFRSDPSVFADDPYLVIDMKSQPPYTPVPKKGGIKQMLMYRNNTSRLFACLLGLFGLFIGPQVGWAEPAELSKKKSLIGMSLGNLEGAPVPLGAAQETTHPKLDSALAGLLGEA